MEGGLMDEVYGDLSQDNRNTALAFDEDSVDIYSGLESPSPRIYPNAERNYTLLSPQNLKSMDLYEEIITEEQQDKDSSYNELRTRFNAAQSQVEELLRRLQQIETQNTKLNTENSRLKKNICALIKTAKMEVVRKDEEINRLSQRFRPGRGRAAHHQSQMSCLKNLVPARQNPTGPSSPSQPQVPTKLNPTGPHPPTQSPGPRQDCVLKDLHQLLRQDRDVVLPPPPFDATVFRPPLPVTSKTSRGDSEAPVKRADSSVSSSSKDSVNRHYTRELGPSDEPKQTEHREGRGENPRLSESKEQRHKNSPHVNKESLSDERNRSHRAQKDIGKYDLKSKGSGGPHPSDVEINRRSDGAKSPHSDILHCTASSYRTSKGLSKDSADIQSKVSSQHDKVLSCDKDDDDDDRHSKSIKDISSKNRRHAYSNQASLTQRSSEYFNRKGGTSPPRDHRRKEEVGREYEIRKEKNGSGERKSTCIERRRTKERDRRSADISKDKNMGNGKVREQKMHEESEVLPPEAKVAEESSIEENSPNIKLSFMETLNLTLSPVKMPRQPAEVKEHEEGTPPDEVPEDQSVEDSGQPDLGELLVLDKINSSVVETHEVFENPVVQISSEIPMAPEPESMESRHTEKESCNDAEKGLSDATVDKEQHKCQLEVENSTVQDGSEGRPELSEAIEGQRTKTTTPEPLRKDCVSFPDCDIVSKTPLKLEECTSESKIGTPEDLTTTVTENCGNNSNTDTGLSANGLPPKYSTGDSVVITDNCVHKSNSETLSALVCKSQSVETVTQDPPATACGGQPAVEDGPGKQKSESLQLSPLVQPEGLQQHLPSSIISNSSLEKDVTEEVQDISKNAVSSTISMEVEIGITSEVISEVTEMPVECEKEKTVVEQSSPLSSVGVSTVSSTTGEVAAAEQHNSGLAETPKKSLNSEASYTENEVENVEPSSSIPMAHDEDSMMLTLSSLKVIPHAISPLKSPVRSMRKSQQLPCHSKPAYVKSLRKEFYSATGDSNSKKLEVNKENSNPGCSVTRAAQQDVDGTSVHPSNPEEELEEGEIVSESEEEETQVTPSSPAKTVRPTRTIKNPPSPKSSPRFSKKPAKENCLVSQRNFKLLTSPVGSPTSNKTRYKTVQPLLPKAAFSTVEEVMAMLAKIRYECRKKYMKLHSTFPKKTFCGVMDMSFFPSFANFVDSVSFIKLCSQEYDLKVKLKNIIMSVLSKLSNNGIVNRIFDQEPLNMKSKLWEFVDVQLDFLFKEIQTALRSVCKSSNRSQSAGAEKKPKLPVKSPKLPVKSPKLPVKSPKLPVKSPKLPVKSPKLPVKSPKLPVKSPKLPVRSPKLPVRSPKLPVRSPKLPVRSPKLPVRSPKLPVRSPKLPVRSPKLPVRSPKLPVRSPKLPVRSPKLPVRSPKLPVRSPKLPVRSPKLPVKSPKPPVKSLKPSVATELKRQGVTRTRTSAPKRLQEELTECVETNMKGNRSRTVPPCKTGLGKGKNIKMFFEEGDKESEPQTSDPPVIQPPLQHVVEILRSNSSSSAERTSTYVRRLSQNVSLHDKPDFEILTEQQASSLTFNLVTDSQMGEIFKCLLQGSDLLETNVSAGDSHGWPLGTPLKEREHFLGVTTPSKVGAQSKVGTPSKLLATWSAISPIKFSSPNSKVKISQNPALLDESCMLEVPSGLPESRMKLQSSVFSHRSYSILAEDLSGSLTIPSPLKSDNNLSFLHPASGEPMSAPDSVISAHFSEDALMDREDATEQDIHLALDTDNSSGASSGGCRTRESPVNPLFYFKPHLPMQAEVMEKSNDHFIVRIRHANTNSGGSATNSGGSATNSGGSATNSGGSATNLGGSATSPSINSTNPEVNSIILGINTSSPGSVNSTYPGNNATNPGNNCTYPCVNSTSPEVICTNPGINPTSADINRSGAESPQTPPGEEKHGKDKAQPLEKNPSKAPFSEASPPFYLSSLSTSTKTASALSSPCLTIIEDTPERDRSKGKTGKKRTKHHVEIKAKRAKKVIPEKSMHKHKSSKSPKGKGTGSSKRERSEVNTPPQSTLSPNSLPAKNIIVKRGEVVVTWTRDEDRDILLALKMKGASPDTFSALSEEMNKKPSQIAKRFSQLMKLFKKKEKMAS